MLCQDKWTDIYIALSSKHSKHLHTDIHSYSALFSVLSITDTHRHTLMDALGQSGFIILLRDTLTCRLVEIGLRVPICF